MPVSHLCKVHICTNISVSLLLKVHVRKNMPVSHLCKVHICTNVSVSHLCKVHICTNISVSLLWKGYVRKNMPFHTCVKCIFVQIYPFHFCENGILKLGMRIK